VLNGVMDFVFFGNLFKLFNPAFIKQKKETINIFMSFLEMDTIKIYLSVEHQVVWRSRNDNIVNKGESEMEGITLILEDFFGRFGS
jgi:hypothetical protein